MAGRKFLSPLLAACALVVYLPVVLSPLVGSGKVRPPDRLVADRLNGDDRGSTPGDNISFRYLLGSC